MFSRLLDNASFLDHEHTPRACAVALGCVFIGALTLLAVQFIQTANYQPYQQQPSTQRSTEPSSYKSQTITSQHLFGRVAAGSAQQLDKLNLPQTQLQLLLRGVFTSSNPRLASAIIEIPGQKTHAYKVNSTVYGDAKLHAVHKDRIVLSRDGQLETLYFPQTEIASSSSHPVAAPNTGVTSDIVNLVKENATLSEVTSVAKQLSSAKITPEQRQQLIRQRLQELRDRARQ